MSNSHIVGNPYLGITSGLPVMRLDSLVTVVLLTLTDATSPAIFNRMVEGKQTARLDRIFSALADPTRRAILQTLTQSPSTITEIAKPFPVSFNAISKHVMVLERAGLLHREIKGREHHCWIDPDPLAEASMWLEHYRRFWEQRLDALQVYVARKFKASKRGRVHGKLR